MVRLLTLCDWCGEAMEEDYAMLWQEKHDKVTNSAFVHLECEIEFKKDRGGHWFDELVEVVEIYIDPVIAKWKAEHQD